MSPPKQNHKTKRARSRRRTSRKRSRVTSVSPPSTSPSTPNSINSLEKRIHDLEALVQNPVTTMSSSGNNRADISMTSPMAPVGILSSTPTACEPTRSRHLSSNTRIDADNQRNREILTMNETQINDYNRSRYVGRLELIPEFDSSVDGMKIDQWLEKIHTVSELYNWDDRAKIYCAIGRLKGNAKLWYDCQTTTESTLLTNPSEHEYNNKTIILPQEKINISNNVGFKTILNLSKEPISFVRGYRVARGIPFGQLTAEVPTASGTPLTDDIQDELNILLEKYDNCFAANNAQLGNTNIEMKIKLTSDTSVCYRPYRLSYHEREVVRNIVKDLLENDIIEPTVSPYASPIILVKKKSGEIRMCVDYRKLNSITEKDRYPLPRIEDQLEQISGNTYFTILDLASGYHQLKLEKESRQYTAFVTPDGHYQYKRGPFGLANAPSVFQRAINEILGSLRFTYALAYLDDILILSKGEEQGLERLEEVLKTFREAGVTLRKEKCLFLQQEVEYLGSVISNGEIKPSPRKVEAVQNFPVPENVHDIRKFLGLASYFRKFIKSFALKAKPLTLLTKLNISWKWEKDQEKAFEEIKSDLSKQPVLALYDPKLEIQLHTDASKSGLGAVLLQKQIDGIFKPVYYMSQQTSPTEMNYHSFELETLAVVTAVRKFRNFLYGRHFTIITDCNALRLTWTKKDLSPRVGRWWLELQEYDFDVIYRPGIQMKHVDTLSRKPCPVNLIKEADWAYVVQLQDENCVQIKKNIENGTDKNYKLVDDRICRVVNGENKILIPKHVQWRIVKQYHDDYGHPGFKRTLEAISNIYWFSKMRRFIKKYVESCIPCLCTKRPTGRRRGFLHPIERVARPFHTLHLDHLGPFCKTKNGNVHLLVVVDGFTKFTWLEAVPDTSTKPIITCLLLLMKIYGHPERIISDRGKGFTSSEMAVVGDNYDLWEDKILEVQQGINGTMNSTTGVAPSELLYGFKPCQKYDVNLDKNITNKDRQAYLKDIRQKALGNINKSARAMKRRYDQNRL